MTGGCHDTEKAGSCTNRNHARSGSCYECADSHSVGIRMYMRMQADRHTGMHAKPESAAANP